MLQFARKVSASAAFVTAWARRFPFLGVQVNPFSAIAPVPVSFLNAASTLAFSQFEGGGLHFTRLLSRASHSSSTQLFCSSFLLLMPAFLASFSIDLSPAVV
ncbi:uncharacterized protein [Arachis hypogaea]